MDYTDELKAEAITAFRDTLVFAKDHLEEALEPATGILSRERAILNVSDDGADYLHSAMDLATEMMLGWMVGYDADSILRYFEESLVAADTDGMPHRLDNFADYPRSVLNLAKKLGYEEE